MMNPLEQMFDELADDITSTMNAPEGAHKTVRAIIRQYKKQYTVHPQNGQQPKKPNLKKQQRDTNNKKREAIRSLDNDKTNGE